MLDVEALSKLSAKPRIDEISLELLRQYYERYLEPYTYIFELDNGVIIKLDFRKEHLCHLLGIEKMAKGAVRYHDRFKYCGLEGYKNIQKRDITIKHLKSLNKGRFNFIKDKLVFFYLLPYIVHSPEILLDFVTGEDNSLIEAKLLAYMATEEAYVHVGIDEDESTKRFFPRTYLIERINETSDGTKFIKGRTPFRVLRAQKMERSSTEKLKDGSAS
ncbi:MAG: PBECR4 domain-containing protein [Paenibacillus macerans]|uniref:Phage-Barnase-EndoU-ColicinE5/D-RelE like nuclease 4 domain-containing protein n=1 Tax=Paenibacillus macerans TaxID=44252 RepID=A0A6N8ES78_PAEMA|nr:PBECR4 domain-containing protein [Paenibacillus macerans]MBS5909585.1 hypothetical protein [Paenibacillus macerans]MDU7471826.1 PBECR4 domain-containing protein [Paenibacillus macerans]MEC0136847.1 PBECR4 domain-containing protein [Paenibacillus macerans]MUG21098.1 hypothetical protein [Paenibacillus macerans]UMV48584.1 PBECR4 domain-containing protein [Paenibacillus macerans]